MAEATTTSRHGETSDQTPLLLDTTEAVVGMRLGRYVVERLLGTGGFGAVLLAWDPALKRHVAIKVARDARKWTAQDTAAFFDEAQHASKINHANVVSIYDIQQTESGALYVIMEYVDGVTLADLLKAGRLDPPAICKLMAQVAAGMHAGHRAGLIHRDLKPGNILISQEGVAKVADFGLSLHEDRQRFCQGQIAGTPAYMSPEQTHGDMSNTDGRSDIWSFGVVLYYVLTNKLPFVGETTTAMFESIRHHLPRPPRQINDQIPAALEALCLKCLQKDPAHRPATALDVQRELEQVCHGSRAWLLPAALVAAVLLFAGWVGLQLRADSIDNPASFGSITTYQAGPANVDQHGRRVELTGSPVPIIPAGNRPGSMALFDAEDKRFLLAAEWPTVYLLPRVAKGPRCCVQTAMSLRAAGTSAGLFYGLRNIPTTHDPSKRALNAVTIQFEKGMSTANLAVTYVELSDHPSLGTRATLCRSKGRFAAKLSAPVQEEVNVDLTTQYGRLVGVRVNGENVLDDGMIRQLAETTSQDAGGLGLFAEAGTVAYRNISILE